MSNAIAEAWVATDEKREALQAAHDKTVADLLAKDPDGVLPEKSKELQGLERSVVMRIARHCAGPLYDVEHERARWNAWYEIARADKRDPQKALLLLEQLRANAQKFAPSGFTVSVKAFPDPAKEPDAFDPAMWIELQRAILPLVRIRGARIGRRCGANVNRLIVAKPLDGKQYKEKCPKCGTENGWTAPRF